MSGSLVVIVPGATVAVVERIGRYSRTLEPGLHFVIPFVDRVRSFVDLREYDVELQSRPLVTAVGRSLDVCALIRCQVVDPRAAVYETHNHLDAVAELGDRTLRDAVASMDSDPHEAFVPAAGVESTLRRALETAGAGWGLRIGDVEVLLGAEGRPVRIERPSPMVSPVEAPGPLGP